MVFIQIPTKLTDEEQMLKRKYDKLKRKKKTLQAIKAPKPEPPPVQVVVKRSSESGADAKEVAKKLLKAGKIHAIKAPPTKERQDSGFKRSKAVERKRCGGPDKPGGYQPFDKVSHSIDEDNVALEDIPSNRVKPLYESFVSARDPETIAREETFKEKRKDGKANYVNRDTPQAGKTIYVHGFGVDEPTLRTGFSIFGNILNINAETDKNCGFITFDTIESANQAITEMNQKSVNGIKLKVSFARRQPNMDRTKSESSASEPSVHQTSSPNDWSKILMNAKSGVPVLKEKRSIVSYEENDLFS